MMIFSEYIAKSRMMNLPDAVTSLRLAGVSHQTPNGEEMARLLHREKKRTPAVKKNAHRTINRLDGQSAPSAGRRP